MAYILLQVSQEDFFPLHKLAHPMGLGVVDLEPGAPIHHPGLTELWRAPPMAYFHDHEALVRQVLRQPGTLHLSLCNIGT